MELEQLTSTQHKMASVPTSNPPMFPEELQFDGTNYVNFQSHVIIAVRAHGAKGYLDGTITCPEIALANTSQTTKPNPSTAITESSIEPTKWPSKTPLSEE